eukprot:COSAG01_NODE_431_length_17124_cov_26.577386_23_plen_211_part_00
MHHHPAHASAHPSPARPTPFSTVENPRRGGTHGGRHRLRPGRVHRPPKEGLGLLPREQQLQHEVLERHAPAQPFPSSIFLDKNRRGIGKYQSIWTDSKMETAGSQHLRLLLRRHLVRVHAARVELVAHALTRPPRAPALEQHTHHSIKKAKHSLIEVPWLVNGASLQQPSCPPVSARGSAVHPQHGGGQTHNSRSDCQRLWSACTLATTG